MNSYDIFGNYITVKKPQVEKFTNNKNIENFNNTSTDIKTAINQVYQADVEAIRNLSNVATKLQKEGLTMPGHLSVSGRASVGTPDTPATFPEWLSLSVNNNTDTHIRLKTKNDDNKNTFLINRDGHFRIHQANVGDIFGVDHNGHVYTRHTGDHVAHHEGDGNNPYITLGKTGTWANQKVYLQNVNAHTDDPTFRIGVHGKDPLMDINRKLTKLPSKMFVGSNEGDDGWGMLNVKNRHGSHAGWWSHLNWVDGNNYLRGSTIQDGNLTTNGTLNVNGALQIGGSPLIHTKIMKIPVNGQWHNTGVDHTNWNIMSISPLYGREWEPENYYIGKDNGQWIIWCANARHGGRPANVEIRLLVSFVRTNISSTNYGPSPVDGGTNREVFRM